jgi:hypothetical protein
MNKKEAAGLLANFMPVWLVLLLALPILLSLPQFWGGSAARDSLFAPPASLLAAAFPKASDGTKDAAAAETKPAPPPSTGWGSFFQERKTLVRLRVSLGFIGVTSLIAIVVAGAAMMKYQQQRLLIAAVILGGIVGFYRISFDGGGKRHGEAEQSSTAVPEGVPENVIQKVFESRYRLADPWNPSASQSKDQYDKAISSKAEHLANWRRRVVDISMALGMMGAAFALFGFSSLLTNLKGRDVTLADVRQRLNHMREIMFTASLLLVSGVACTSCMHEFLFFSVKHVEGVAAYAEILNLRTGAQYTALLALAYWTTLLPLEKRAEELGALKDTPPTSGNAAPTAAATGLLPDGWKTMLPRLLGILAPLLTEPLMKVLDMGFHGLQ